MGLAHQPGRRCWNLHNRPQRHVPVHLDARAVWSLVRQGRLPMVRRHQHVLTGFQCGQHLRQYERLRMRQQQHQQHLCRVWRRRRSLLIG